MVACPVCDSSDYKVLFRDYNRRDKVECSGTYAQCCECSLVYLRERPLWEEIAKLYSVVDSDITANIGQVDARVLLDRYNRPVPVWKKLLRRVRFRPHSWPLASVSQGSKRLLDLGCGSGAKLLEFADRGYEIWGVDVGADAIRSCREILPQGHFIRGELQSIGLPDAHFDYIRLDNVLEHIPNLQEVVKECFRLLRRRGRLMVYVPHARSLSMRLMKGNSISSWIPFHLQLFTRQSLYWLTAEAGFEDVHIHGYNPPNWFPLTLIQWRNVRRDMRDVPLSPRFLEWVCRPVTAFSGLLRMHEELVAVCDK